MTRNGLKRVPQDGDSPLKNSVLIQIQPAKTILDGDGKEITTLDGNFSDSTKFTTNNNEETFKKSNRPSSAESVRIVQSSLSKFSRSITNGIENFFFWYGKFVATHSVPVILACIVIALICSIGLTQFTTEERPFKLWIPQDSDFIKMHEWKTKNFPEKYRIHIALYMADNVLDKKLLLQLLKVHEVIANTSTYVYDIVPNEQNTFNDTPRYVTWDNKCLKIPTNTYSFFNRRKRDLDSNSLLSKENFPTNFLDHNYSLPQATKTKADEKYPEWHSIEEADSSDWEKMRDNSRSKRQIGFDWTSYLTLGSYCELLEVAERACLEKSLLEIWGYDRKKIESLTQEEILNDVNSANISAVFGNPTKFEEYLGLVRKDNQGNIVGAGAMLHTWFTEVDLSKVIPGSFIDLYGSGTENDVDGYRWEQNLIKNLSSLVGSFEYGEMYFLSSQSFNEVSQKTLDDNGKLIPLGYVVVFVYVQIMLGKLNMVEARPMLSVIGITSVVMGIGISYGICFSFGLIYSIVNNVLPFLLLALGIDDMFVIMQALHNLTPDEKKADMPIRIGYAMKNAGASIVITSATDIAAFAVGAFTSLPALHSFCLYASVGIIAIFILQVTFFVAWIPFDEKRIQSKRNSFLCCLKMKNWKPLFGQKAHSQLFFKNIYSKYLLNPKVKAVILFLTFSYFAVSCWGVSYLKQKFDPVWLFPTYSYVYKFFMGLNHAFPEHAYIAHIYFSDLNLAKELPKLDILIDGMHNDDNVGPVDAWYPAFKQYFEEQGYDIPVANMTEEDFQHDLSTFLHSPAGFQFQKNFVFESPLNCSETAPKVTSSSIEFKYVKLNETSEKLSAMRSVKKLIRSINFTGFVESYSSIHSSWETDAILERELFSNLFLAVTVVFLMTFALLASMVQSLFVLSCVIMTLIDVGALIHWWGLTIDAASCIDMVLAVGLCVDYAVHVGKLKIEVSLTLLFFYINIMCLNINIIFTFVSVVSIFSISF